MNQQDVVEQRRVRVQRSTQGRSVIADGLEEGDEVVFGQLIGYVGVDLVLGVAGDGGDDAVIEINPRLTTSYLALRRLLRTNLAAAMLAVARGDHVELCRERSHVRFDIT